ncbi:MAG: hypothetical protein P8Y45_21725 [Exilibacterium sp.]
MDLEAWTVNLSTLSAEHESGFTIEIEGNPTDPSSVNPGRFPAELNSIEQTRLLRYGMEAIAKAAKSAKTRTRASAPKKPAYIPPPNKPRRPVLSLKNKKKA